MKKLIIIILLSLSVYLTLMLSSGFAFSQTEGVTQNDIDMSTNPAKLAITGTTLGEASVAHNGREISADSTIRDAYTNMSKVKAEIKPGTIFTKRVYAKKKDGTKGELEMIFAMVKQKKDYYMLGGNWEYVIIAPDKSTDYKVHPNGMLPPQDDGKMRGKIAACIGCHKVAAGNDYIFTNSDDTKTLGKPEMMGNPCKPKCNPCKPE